LEPPPYEQLALDTTVCYPDLDASLTKAWMITHRAQIPTEFALGFGKRPAEELYDLRCDPDYLTNLAEEPAYAETKAALRAQLMEILIAQADPRVVESPCRFEDAPYGGLEAGTWN
jgi:hypothetical protein